MRADAKKNYDQLLAVARDVVTEQGADASLRDVARKAGVGLGTLYRHFPTRESLLEALLRACFDELTTKASELGTSSSPDAALVSWLREAVTVTRNYRRVTESMMAAIADPDSALHESCVTMRAAGTRLLDRAQADGVARADLDGTDLFALVGALAWLGDQPSLEPRADHLFDVIASAILTNRSSVHVKSAPRASDRGTLPRGGATPPRAPARRSRSSRGRRARRGGRAADRDLRRPRRRRGQGAAG